MTDNTVTRAELGQSMPLIVIMFIVLCGFVGLTIDVGNGMLAKRQLQASVDLGLLSGARDLPNATTASTTARAYVKTNLGSASDSNVTINTAASCMVPGCAKPDKLTLSAAIQTPTYFVKLFGVDKWNVAAHGSACAPCDSTPVKFDVIVVLDRSGSMSGEDMDNARDGIRELLNFFDPKTDRVGLTVLEPADSNDPYFSTDTSPCETDRSSFSSSSYLPSAYTGYGGAAGAFMDGTASNHDNWLVVPLASGTNFKKADGTLNDSSSFLSTLDCVKDGGSTPIGPAVDAARQELDAHGRSDAVKVMVYFGDGGASSMPLKRQCRSRTSSHKPWDNWRDCTTADAAGGNNVQWDVTGNPSWYTWTTGNRDRPCQDAIDQAARAHNDGIDVYTIGYGVGTDYCRPGVANSPPEVPNILQSTTIKKMASDSDKYYQQAQRGDVGAIFAAVGRDITSGGTRLVD